MKKLIIYDEFIRLCDALKFAGIAETGGIAKLMILDGEVTVNGEPCLQKGKKLYPGDVFSLEGEQYQIAR